MPVCLSIKDEEFEKLKTAVSENFEGWSISFSKDEKVNEFQKMKMTELKSYLENKGVEIPLKGSGKGGCIKKSDLVNLAKANTEITDQEILIEMEKALDL